MSKKVGLIMINYKSYAERFLQESYDSLLQVDYSRGDYNLYIVDNVTSEETRKLCQNLAPAAKIISTDGNGWGHANNLGVKTALEDGCEYIFFLNMDTEFDPSFIREAIKVYEADRTIGIVQSKLLMHPAKNGEYMLNSKGDSMTFLGFGYCAGDGKKDNVADKVVDITYASGAAILISRETWEKIGECDSSYFMYHDDAEISFKVKLVGLRVVLAPRSVVYHKHEFGRSVRQIYFMELNRMRFLLEFFKLKTLLLIFPAFILMEIGMFPYAILNKWVIAKLKIYLWFINPKNILTIIRKRKKIQSLRKVSDSELLKGVVGVVDFQQINNPILKYIANPIFDFYWRIVRRLI